MNKQAVTFTTAAYPYTLIINNDGWLQVVPRDSDQHIEASLMWAIYQRNEQLNKWG